MSIQSIRFGLISENLYIKTRSWSGRYIIATPTFADVPKYFTYNRHSL